MLLSFAVSSLKSRAKSVVLTFLSLLISISVLLSVEHVRMQAESSFSRTVSDVDLIVGAPSGQLNLMLYSIFRMGSPTNNISYESVEMLKTHSQVEWVIPISLGDSHHGFRVLGTNQDYFEHYKYGDKQPLAFASGQPFSGVFGAVIGADVAKKLGYQIGDKIVVAHGTGMVSFTNHDQSPFTITGILAATGTPVDKTVHVSLEGIEAMHLSSSKLKPIVANPDDTSNPLIQPDDVTAVMLGLKSKFATFTLQRELNNYQDDRLMAILPGVAMAELWKMMGTVENLLDNQCACAGVITVWLVHHAIGFHAAARKRNCCVAYSRRRWRHHFHVVAHRSPAHCHRREHSVYQSAHGALLGIERLVGQ